jgi:hypothetical protein
MGQQPSFVLRVGAPRDVNSDQSIVIAAFFILTIVLTSLVSRVWRTTELRTEKVEVDETARRFIDEASGGDEIHIVANRRQTGDERDYFLKEREQRQHTHIPSDVLLFLEVDVGDPSEFEDVLEVRGVEVNGYCAPRARRFRTPSPPSCSTCATRQARRRTATSIGPRGIPLGTCSATSCWERGTQPRSPTRSCAKPSRTRTDVPSSTSPANKPANHQTG